MTNKQIIFSFLTLAFSLPVTLFSQEWSWQRDNLALNPSGLELTGATGWVWGDMNGDALPDVILLKQGLTEDSRLEFWQGVANDHPPYWMLQPDFFASLQSGEIIGDLSLADLDGDGGPNIITYQDTGTGWRLLYWRRDKADFWQADTTVFAGVSIDEQSVSNVDPSFADFDADGDLDMLIFEVVEFDGTSFGGGFRVFENIGSKQGPMWREDPLSSQMLSGFPPGYNPRSATLLHANDDSIIDVVAEGQFEFESFFFIYAGVEDSAGVTWGPEFSNADIKRPDHGTRKIWVFDLDRDGRQDLLHLERGGSGRIFMADPELPEYFDSDYFRVGALGFRAPNFEAPASLLPFDYDGDGAMDLLAIGFFYDSGLIRNYHAYEAEILGFRKLWRNTHWLGFSPFGSGASFKVELADLDQNGLIDFVRSELNLNLLSSPGISAYENPDPNLQAAWRSKNELVARFRSSHPDTLYFDQAFGELDGDGDADALVTELIMTGADSGRSRHLFFENRGTADALTWVEKPAWQHGLDATVYAASTLSDLDRDGDTDLIFATEEGTLILYEDIGAPSAPVWRLRTDVFAGIWLETIATIAFAYLDADSQPDLFVSSDAGEMFFYRNESTVAVAERIAHSPTTLPLRQNYPNPFNPETTIRFLVPANSNCASCAVRLEIYNVLGELIRVLVDEPLAPGEHSVTWDGTDRVGSEVASGVYIYKLRYGEKGAARRMLLLR